MNEHHLPPLPWSYTTNQAIDARDGVGHVYLLDANNRKIASLWGKADEKLATAELICNAADELAGTVGAKKVK